MGEQMEGVACPRVHQQQMPAVWLRGKWSVTLEKEQVIPAPGYNPQVVLRSDSSAF